MNINQTHQIASVTAAQKPQKALEVAHQFEEIFTKMMVQSFRKAQLSDEGGMFGDSVGSDTYEQWFDEHMARYLGKTNGIGIADTLIRDLRRHGELPEIEPGAQKKGTQTMGVTHVA